MKKTFCDYCDKNVTYEPQHVVVRNEIRAASGQVAELLGLDQPDQKEFHFCNDLCLERWLPRERASHGGIVPPPPDLPPSYARISTPPQT